MVSPVSAFPEAQAQLAELLLDLFSPDELRRFVHLRYPKLEHDLREGTSHRGQTESLVETLLRHGEIDADLFSNIRRERPKRAAEIDAVADLVASQKIEMQAPSTSTLVNVQVGSLPPLAANSPGCALSSNPSPASVPGRPPASSRSARFKNAIGRFDPDGDPSLAINNGLHIAEPGQSFVDRTLARLELRPRSSHILSGPHGTGKTTQLRILYRTLSMRRELIPVYVDAATVTGDLSRPGTLSGLLVEGARDIEVLEQGTTKPDPFSTAIFRAFASGRPGTSLVRAISKLQHARRLVLMLDLQDQVSAKSFAALCEGELAELMKFMPIVVVAPLSALSASTRDQVAGFEYCSRQPIYDPSRGGAIHAFLMQIIHQRADDLIAPECFARLVDASGGALSDLLGLGQVALEEAFLANYDRVEPQQIDHTIEIFGRKRLAGLDTDDMSRLQQLHHTGTFAPTDDRNINLLATRRVLERTAPTGATTFAVHPALLPVLPVPTPLDYL